jgi:uncharacterized membrane protein YphA (DoxX/SURF4 family)
VAIVYARDVANEPARSPLWLKVLTAVLALTFAITGIGKLASISPSPENFTRWGFSMSFMYMIGAVEIGGGLALLVPRLSVFAALGLIVTMFGAARTGIVFGEAPHIVFPLVLIVLLAIVVVARREQLSRLLRRFSRT